MKKELRSNSESVWQYKIGANKYEKSKFKMDSAIYSEYLHSNWLPDNAAQSGWQSAWQGSV